MESATEWHLLLVRYGEIAIKSRAVRDRWERRLLKNLEDALVRRGTEAEVTRQRGRVFVRATDKEGALNAVRHTFGVVNTSFAVETAPTLEAMREVVRADARHALKPGTRFAVRARRTGEHPFTSVEAGKDLGSAAYEAAPEGDVHVDLTDPEVTFHFDIRPEVAYFYREVIPGPGGLPVGTAGKVVILLEDARGALAAWRMMKRGATPLVLVPDTATGDPDAVLDQLADWAPTLRVARVAVPADAAGDPARRRAFLLKAAGLLARRKRAHAVVVGDGLAGVAAHSALDHHAEAPVFRPLTGFEGDALDALARDAGLPAHAEPADVPELADAPVDGDAVRDALHGLRMVEVGAA